MAMDDDDQVNSAAGGQEEAASPPGSIADEIDAGIAKPEEKGGRMNAAKAFYRAMYAGEEANPEDYGISLEKTGGSPAADSARVKELEAHVGELEGKVTEIDTLYKRMAADFENYRRRTDREREEFAANGALKAIEAILPAMDDLDRAQMTLNATMDPKNILESFKLVGNSFTRCLEQIGAKALTVIGEPFDPRLHEPVQEIRTNEYPDSTVIHELRRGFMYKERVLRPALVNVTAALDEDEVAALEQAKAAESADATPNVEVAPAVEETAISETSTADSIPAVEVTSSEAAPEEEVSQESQVYDISESDALPSSNGEEHAEAQLTAQKVSDD